MIKYEKQLDMFAGATPAAIYLSQYDEDFTLEFELYSSRGVFSIESGTTVEIRGTKTDGNGYSADASLSGNIVTVNGDKQMTACAGEQMFELVLKKGDKKLSSCNFVLAVERAALDKDTIPSESVIRELIDVIDRTDEIIGAAEMAEAACNIVEGYVDQAEDDRERAEIAANLAEQYGTDFREPLLACLRNVAWTTEDGEELYQALYEVMYPVNKLSSISAFLDTSTHDVYAGDTLASLRPYLTVTGRYLDNTTGIITGYTLSGSLANTGVSIITVSYGGKSTSVRVWVIPEGATVTDIEATFTQGTAEIHEGDNIDILRQYLAVTASYSDGTSAPVTSYGLSGTLEAGANTITVTYRGFSDTFDVVVASADYITATFSAGGATIYTDDSLNDLKQYLTVTYYHEDVGTVVPVADYTLSGTLTEGTSIITVTYEGLRTNVSVIGVVDFYNIWNWSLSNGDFIKLAASTDRASDSLTGIYISLAETRPSVQYRRHCTVKRGKLPYTDYISHELSQYYPIPIPNGVNKIKVSVTPSTQFTFMNVVKYNSETNKYERYAGASGVNGWTQGINEKTITASDNLFLFFNMKYDSAGTSYPTEPSNITVTFEEV